MTYQQDLTSQFIQVGIQGSNECNTRDKFTQLLDHQIAKYYNSSHVTLILKHKSQQTFQIIAIRTCFNLRIILKYICYTVTIIVDYSADYGADYSMNYGADYSVDYSRLWCRLQRIMVWIIADYGADYSRLWCGLQQIMVWIIVDYGADYDRLQQIMVWIMALIMTDYSGL